jgi:hypothetical protein
MSLVGRSRGPGDFGWWVVLVNHSGYIPFLSAGVARFHSSDDVQGHRIRSGRAETAADALCFAIGGDVAMFHKPTSAET